MQKLRAKLSCISFLITRRKQGHNSSSFIWIENTSNADHQERMKKEKHRRKKKKRNLKLGLYFRSATGTIIKKKNPTEG